MSPLRLPTKEGPELMNNSNSFLIERQLKKVRVVESSVTPVSIGKSLFIGHPNFFNLYIYGMDFAAD